MTITASRSQAESMLHKEFRQFKDELTRVANCALNKTFELTVRGSERRNRTLILVFITLGIFFTLRAHPLEAWGNELSLLFQYLFNPSIAQASPDTPRHFFEFTFGAVLAPRTLRYLPILVLPFFIALKCASIYLADIFEIEDQSIARDFLTQVALTGSRNSIRIGNGEVADAYRKSPIYLIGGPGQVVVELDTAALFEKPNGQPRVIGPTVKGKAVLEGFERFRQAIDLRDQYTDPMIVQSRSLDGIPVTAQDVRLLFSVSRENQERSALSPYPFSAEAIEKLVYGQVSRVVKDGPHPSEPPSSWTETVIGLIRSELSRFMREHRLADYLASIGSPEVENARKREHEIIKIGKGVLSDGDNLEPREITQPSNFQPRHLVSSLFSRFTEGFSENARERGARLVWIGIGIWHTPNEIVPEKHLEAWRLSRENLGRGSPGALEALRNEAQIQQMLRLVQNVPLERFRQNAGKDHNLIVRELLNAYREQLIDSIELQAKNNRQNHPIVRAAIKHIEMILGIKHWIGPASAAPGADTPIARPRPASPGLKTEPARDAPPAPLVADEEKALYLELYNKSGQDATRAQRLIEYERRFAPQAKRKELIQRAIERLLKDT